MSKNNKVRFNSISVAYLMSTLGLLYNLELFRYFLSSQAELNFQNTLYLISFIVFIFCITNITHIVIISSKIHKFIIPIMIILNASGFYFVKSFHILIDKNMITNLLETDLRESAEYFNLTFFFYFIFFGLLPIFVYLKYVEVIKESYKLSIIKKLKHIAFNLLVIISLFFGVNKLFTSYLRSHREVKHMIFPVNYIAATVAKIKRINKAKNILNISNSTELLKKWSLIKNKTVVVLILGETSRAKNFSLNGYNKLTNPLLENEKELISFKKFFSCGTSTAESLPCMFSPQDKEHFDPEENSENLLDVIQKAGFKVSWVENNSGCKGVCDRTHFIQTKGYDYEMVNQLPSLIENSDSNKIFIILHQLGSHGPSYFKRYPKDFGTFKPTCDTDQLYDCTQEEVANSYDNTILVTDKLISDTVNLLKSYSDFNTSVVYLSDHGESLGENNLYLHGIPYWMAPEDQKHIPFIFWSSSLFQKNFNIKNKCLLQKEKQTLSHDHLFHSILGMLKIKNNYYQGGYDVFKDCNQWAYQKRPSIK